MSKSPGASATRCATAVWIVLSPAGRKILAQRFIAGLRVANQNESRRDERKDYHALLHQLPDALRVGYHRTPRPLIKPDFQQRLWPYLGGIARENKMKALVVGCVQDHVHVLLSISSDKVCDKVPGKVRLKWDFSGFKMSSGRPEACPTLPRSSPALAG